MRLFFDLDRQQFTQGVNSTIPFDAMSQLRSPNASIEIQFFREATAKELAAGATGIFEVKESGKYDANSIFRAGSWVKTGTGTATIYTFTLNLLTTAGDLLLGVEAPVTFTAVAATDLLGATASPPIGSKIQVSTDTTLPGGLIEHQDYFVITAGHTSTNWKVSLTSEGTPVDITSTGSGTNQFRRIDDDAATVSLMAAMQFVAGGQTTESQKITFNYTNDIVRDGDTGPVADPADVVLNVQAGKESIPSGSTGESVVFGTAFAGGSNVSVVVSYCKATAGDDQIFADPVADSITETGFDYELSGATPDANSKLTYMAVAI